VELQKEYPLVTPEFITMKSGEIMSDTLPMNYMTVEDRARCEIAEKFIDEFIGIDVKNKP